MPFLELINIHKVYENAPLLRGVSFSVDRGTIACLLGASGSGKTTLLRIMAGLEAPEQGRILLENEDLTGVPTHRRGIGLMFQDYALFPHKTVVQNVAFGLKMSRNVENKGAITARAREMLDVVGMAGFEQRDVNELSGGERQRVALARSLAPRPRLLLLDEPLGALDRNLRERLLEELPAILRRVGVTAITVTHDQEEAFALADRVILLNEGQVVQAGQPESIYDRPANVWVARFLGLDNLFAATVTASGQVSLPFISQPVTMGAYLPVAGTRGTVLVHTWGFHARGGQMQSPYRFIAQVRRRSFHGHLYRLTLASSGEMLHLTLPAGNALPDVGSTVEGWIDPAALRWLG